MNNALFSSIKQEWQTPRGLFDHFNGLYNFQLDAAATSDNALCPNFYTKKDNALIQNWVPYQNIWLNPPYGREIMPFMEKAVKEATKGCLVACLLPARTDTKWFQLCLENAQYIIFIQGRLIFEGAKSSAPFPSCVVIFNRDQCPPAIKTVNRNVFKRHDSNGR